MNYACSICGEAHDNFPAWVIRAPDHWLGMSDEERALGKCDSDLCRTSDGHFFVRAVLVLPLIDGPQDTVEFGVWGSLSEKNFWRYVETFDDNDQSKLGWMFSYLSNEIGGFPGSLTLNANLHPRDNRLRPLMELEPTDHPLSVAQRGGVPYRRFLEIVHKHGAVP